jgi:hypothetical protein
MPQVGFESTIPVFERAETVYALDRAATGIGYVTSLHRPNTENDDDDDNDVFRWIFSILKDVSTSRKS